MDQTTNAIRAARKSLSDVVAPALDPADPLAREQLALAADLLSFLEERVLDLHAMCRRRGQLSLGLADALVAAGAPETATPTTATLTTATAALRGVLDDPAAGTREVDARTDELDAALRRVVRGAGARAGQVREVVLRSARDWTAADRAWHLPLGFETAADEVPALTTVLAAAGRTAG
jgi:hypothetical protein